MITSSLGRCLVPLKSRKGYLCARFTQKNTKSLIYRQDLSSPLLCEPQWHLYFFNKRQYISLWPRACPLILKRYNNSGGGGYMLQKWRTGSRIVQGVAKGEPRSPPPQYLEQQKQLHFLPMHQQGLRQLFFTAHQSVSFSSSGSNTQYESRALEERPVSSNRLK